MKDTHEFAMSAGEVVSLHNLTHCDLWPALQVWVEKRRGMLAERIDEVPIEQVDGLRGERRALKMLLSLKQISEEMKAEAETAEREFPRNPRGK